MLDDKARMDAKRKQAASCPNCARIQSSQCKTKTAHLKQRQGQRVKSPIRQSCYMSERTHDHLAPIVRNSINAGPNNENEHAPRSNSDVSSFGVEATQSPPVRGTPLNRRRQHGESVLPPISDPVEPPGGQTLRVPSDGPSLDLLGSPITRQILGRQNNTRHASIDLTNETPLGASSSKSSRSYGSIRRFSEVFTVSEPSVANNEARANLLRMGRSEPNLDIDPRDLDENDTCDDTANDDNDSVSTASSHSSRVVLLDEGTIKLRTAKYVFLTLRDALLNSLVIIAVGCIGFWAIEGFSVVNAWYFTTVLLTTVGYGDIVPTTNGGKLFATIYVLVAGTILLNNMSMISLIPLELRRRRIERAVLTQFGDQLDDSALRELATGPLVQKLHLCGNSPTGLEECTREMFSLAMLVRLGKVSEDDIREAFAAFRRLDVNNEGVLNSKSIISGMIKNRKMRSLTSSLHSSGQPSTSVASSADPPSGLQWNMATNE
jgi:voltage-gated potassium channel Kch